MQSLICDVMALQPTISTTESIRRLMQPSWPLAHETIRQHTERQCHCRQAEHMSHRPILLPTRSLPHTHEANLSTPSINVCFWHKADITAVLIHVHFRGVKRT